MNEFEGARRMECGFDVGAEYPRGFQAKNRPNAFASGKNAVPHGSMDGGRRSCFRRKQAFQRSVHSDAILFKKPGKFHFGRAASSQKRAASRLRLFFRLKCLGNQLTVRFLQENLDASFRLFQLFLAFA